VRLNAAVAATACLVLFALTGCLATPVAAPTAIPSPSPSPTPTPEASGPLTCDELVPPELVAATLEGGDGIAVEPVPAAKGSVAFDQLLLEGAGGLACTWRVGSGMPEYNAPSDWAYLTVEVLPGAGSQWVPLSMGDGPSTMTRRIAGLDASISGGDPGWAISAPVGGSWVRATISAAALTSTGGRFLGLGAETMTDRLAQVGEVAFPVLQQADDSRLTWPAVALPQGDAACNGGLDESGILDALEVPEGSAAEIVASEPDAAAPGSFEEAVDAAARTFTCDVQVDGRPVLTITTARGFASRFDRLSAVDANAALVPFELADAPADARAVGNGADGRAAVAYLAIGDSAYAIQGAGAPAVAQAIVAQTF